MAAIAACGSSQEPLAGMPGGEIVPQAVDADDVQNAGEIVAERHQAPLAAHLGKAAQQEVAIADTALQGTKRMLGHGRVAAGDVR